MKKDEIAASKLGTEYYALIGGEEGFNDLDDEQKEIAIKVMNAVLSYDKLHPEESFDLENQPFEADSTTGASFLKIVKDTDITKKVNSVITSLANYEKAKEAGEKLSNKQGSLTRVKKSLKEAIQLSYKITDDKETAWIAAYLIANVAKLPQPATKSKTAKTETAKA